MKKISDIIKKSNKTSSQSDIFQNENFKKAYEKHEEKAQLKKKVSGKDISKQGEKRIKRILKSNELYSHDFDHKFDRTNALRMAKLIAITSFPARKTKDRDRIKVLRLGKNTWVKVTVTARHGRTLPFGEDRFVLAGIIHLAIQQNDPVVFFKTANELLKMFGISDNNLGYKRLRERFKRIEGLSFNFQYGRTREEAEDPEQDNFGENLFCIKKYALPTKKEIDSENDGQMILYGIMDDPELNESPYGVRLSTDFFEYIAEKKNQLVIPVDLLKLFIDRPIGFDFCLFVTSRCYAAKSTSALPHDELMSLFKHGKEHDRDTIRRLQRYLKEIHFATDKRLKVWFEDGEKRGRKKTWNLVFAPSQKLVHSGKIPSLDDGKK